ncbi:MULTISPECIES: prephenate/arogenate dehydrogenase family protein [unclassified Beijerinckia]|uniref:prephenate/arogenate dehydrogenase family protein n=1 Tax=unclassified Beijerinckia TaxID=2638183 RepID=UPI000A6B4FB5|nr:MULTISPECIES: prephenate/arogenate dehydrogenase family protein [unclassified Beijerinckia]
MVRRVADSQDHAPLFDRITIVGVGLIGSSIARVARDRHLARHIVACDSDKAVRERVVELKIADEVIEDVAQACADSDFVVLCAPVGANAAIAAAIAKVLKPGAIVSDVGSVKQAVVDAIAPQLPKGVHFVPAHPVAGTEYSGPDSGFSTLFINRWCILTPPEGEDETAIDKVRRFWEACGANVEVMSPLHHDLVLAITSHVPHLIAYNIVRTADDLESVTQSEVIKFSAGGFRDFTRIAASDPTMWRDVFLNNKQAVLEMLGRFQEDLASLQRMIRWDDGQGLFDLFTRTRAIRRSIIAQGQETNAADFGRGSAPPPKT